MACRKHKHHYIQPIALVAVALVFAACGAVGSGDIITETRQVGDFDRIEISGGIDVDLHVDPAAEQEIIVTFDDNLMDRIITRVTGSTLMIGFESGVQFTGGGRFVAVIANDLEALEVSGGSDVNGSGAVDFYLLEASGGSDAELRDLIAEDVDVDASGGANVDIYASSTVEGDASGGSDVTVHGDPETVIIDTSGGADVNIAD